MVLGWERNIDLQLASAGSEEAVRERVRVSVFSVFLHKAVVFSPEKKRPETHPNIPQYV